MQAQQNFVYIRYPRVILLLKMCKRLHCFSLQAVSLTTRPAYLHGSICAKWVVKLLCCLKRRGCTFCLASLVKTAKPLLLFQLSKKRKIFIVFSPYLFFFFQQQSLKTFSQKKGTARDVVLQRQLHWRTKTCWSGVGAKRMLQSFCCFLNVSYLHLCYLNDANSCIDYNGKYFLSKTAY